MNKNRNNRVDLGQFDDDFRDAQPATRGELDEVPDGKYQVVIENAELTESSAGTPMIKWILRILAPHHQNRLLWRNSVITSKAIKYIKADLCTCGLRLEKFSELEDRMSDLLDVKLEITKRTKGDYENIYFNSRIDGDRGPRRTPGATLAAF